MKSINRPNVVSRVADDVALADFDARAPLALSGIDDLCDILAIVAVDFSHVAVEFGFGRGVDLVVLHAGKVA